MSIQIQLHDTKIPVHFGELIFQFDMGDTSIKNVRKQAVKMQEKINKIEELIEQDEEKAEENAEACIKESFDFLLGEGAFIKIYEQTPSISALADYFIQLVRGIEVEMNKKTHHQKTQQYMNK